MFEANTKAQASKDYRREYYQKNKERILENYTNDTVECPHCDRVVRRPNLKKHLSIQLCSNRQEMKRLLVQKD